MGFMENCTESEKQNGCLGAEWLLASRSHGRLGATVSTGCVWLSHHRNVEKPLNWTIKSWETSIEGCCRTWEEGGRNDHSLAGKYMSGWDYGAGASLRARPGAQGPCRANDLLLRLESVHTFGTGSPAFLFCTKPHKLCSQACCRAEHKSQEQKKRSVGSLPGTMFAGVPLVKASQHCRMWPHGLPAQLFIESALGGARGSTDGCGSSTFEVGVWQQLLTLLG